MGSNQILALNCATEKPQFYEKKMAKPIISLWLQEHSKYN